MTLPESRVLEKLNVVATAKRLANMVGSMYDVGVYFYLIFQELHDSKFGEREEIHAKKRRERE